MIIEINNINDPMIVAHTSDDERCLTTAVSSFSEVVVS